MTILPDLNAGCSMADMAEITQVEDCWETLVRAGITNDAGDGVTPITYMNSTAAIKAFCGERGGVVCTSSNAAGLSSGQLKIALRGRGRPRHTGTKFYSSLTNTSAATPATSSEFL